jgi:hypothetical protein
MTSYSCFLFMHECVATPSPHHADPHQLNFCGAKTPPCTTLHHPALSLLRLPCLPYTMVTLPCLTIHPPTTTDAPTMPTEPWIAYSICEARLPEHCQAGAMYRLFLIIPPPDFLMPG